MSSHQSQRMEEGKVAKKKSAQDFIQMKQAGEKIAYLTRYDYLQRIHCGGENQEIPGGGSHVPDASRGNQEVYG